MALSYQDWLAQQGGDTYASYSDRDPNVDYRSYQQQNTDFSDLSSLPPGFMQSEYGSAYQNVLNQLNDPNYDKNEDPNGLKAWLQNAPVQFGAGRSLAEWGRPTTSANLIGGGAHALDAATVGQLVLGGFGASAFAGGVGAGADVGAAGGAAGSPALGGTVETGIGTGAAGGAAGGGAGGGAGGLGTNPLIGPALGVVQRLFQSPGGGGNAERAQQGGLFDSLLNTGGNLSPAILAGYLGNRQRQDVMSQVGRLNTLGDSLSAPAFMQSITNPYDQQTGQGRTALTSNLQQRGVGGSSFGNQQLGNYDYMRGLGRGDLATRAGTQIAQTQGGLYSDALRGMVGGNAAYNQLLGAGLGASGSLFGRTGTPGGSTGNGIFDWLHNYLGGSGSPTDPNVGGGVPIDDINNPGPGLDAGLPTEPGLDAGLPTEFDPNIDWSSIYG